ncbi:MAG TPA: hypothetical protein DEA71_17375 [Nitrospira sp.]|nr:hypothetical protein [Nitrospira sp.]
MKQLGRIGPICFVLLAILNGCDVPKPYQVANMVNPKDEDVDVRFRTTYYIRVFNVCRVEDGREGITKDEKTGFVSRSKGHYRITKDSLYRFRMTGQAQAFFNDVRFESGTLPNYQIDPFGTPIKFDEIRYHERPETENQDTTANECPKDAVKDTKFYLLGPEGVKELKPSERLVMAMSTDAKPLISALQRVGSIKAQAEANVLGQHRVKLNQIRVTDALEKLNALKTEIGKNGVNVQSSPEALEGTILGLFRGGGGGL